MHLIGTLLIRGNWLYNPCCDLIFDRGVILLQNLRSGPQASEQSLSNLRAELEMVGKRLVELLPWKWHCVPAILKGNAVGELLIERLLFIYTLGLQFPKGSKLLVQLHQLHWLTVYSKQVSGYNAS